MWVSIRSESNQRESSGQHIASSEQAWSLTYAPCPMWRDSSQDSCCCCCWWWWSNGPATTYGWGATYQPGHPKPGTFLQLHTEALHELAGSLAFSENNFSLKFQWAISIFQGVSMLIQNTFFRPSAHLSICVWSIYLPIWHSLGNDCCLGRCFGWGFNPCWSITLLFSTWQAIATLAYSPSKLCTARFQISTTYHPWELSLPTWRMSWETSVANCQALTTCLLGIRKKDF